MPIHFVQIVLKTKKGWGLLSPAEGAWVINQKYGKKFKKTNAILLLSEAGMAPLTFSRHYRTHALLCFCPNTKKKNPPEYDSISI